MIASAVAAAASVTASGCCVNAVITATEAKTQALLEAGIRATGTASDAVCIAAPTAGEHEDGQETAGRWG